MGMDYHYSSDSAYSVGGIKGQYKRWFSRCKRYTGLSALKGGPTKVRSLYEDNSIIDTISRDDFCGRMREEKFVFNYRTRREDIVGDC